MGPLILISFLFISPKFAIFLLLLFYFLHCSLSFHLHPMWHPISQSQLILPFIFTGITKSYPLSASGFTRINTFAFPSLERKDTSYQTPTWLIHLTQTWSHIFIKLWMNWGQHEHVSYAIWKHFDQITAKVDSPPPPVWVINMKSFHLLFVSSQGPLWYLSHSLRRVAIIPLWHVLSVSQNLCFHNQNRLSLWFSLIITEPVAIPSLFWLSAEITSIVTSVVLWMPVSSMMFLEPTQITGLFPNNTARHMGSPLGSSDSSVEPFHSVHAAFYHAEVH